MSESSDRTYARLHTLHSDCTCCEYAAERIAELEEALGDLIAYVDSLAEAGFDNERAAAEATRVLVGGLVTSK